MILYKGFRWLTLRSFFATCGKVLITRVTDVSPVVSIDLVNASNNQIVLTL